MAQQVKIVKKGGFFGKLVALLLGIIIGIIAGIGGLGAGLYYIFGVISIGEALGIVENAASMDIPEEEYVGEEYLDKSLIQALTDAFGIVSGITSGSNTFGDIAKISPYLGQSIAELSTTFSQYGFEMTEDELMAMSAPEFGEYMQTSFGNIALAPLLTEIGGQTIDPSNTIMCALFYGQKGVHYQLVDVDGEQKVEMLPLCYTLESDGNFKDWSNTVYAQSSAIWINEAGDGVIKEESANSADGTIAYTYAYYAKESGVETLSYRLALKDGTTNEYEAYKLDDTKKLHVGATISGLLGDDLLNTMYSLSLADVLGLDASSDPLMLALAYGEGGYKVVEIDGQKQFEYLTDTPKTLNDLINGGSTLVTDMSLATVMNLDMDNAESISPIMKALAFGACDDPGTTEDDLTANYKVVDNKIVMLNDSKPKTVNALKGNTNDLVGDVKLGDIIEITSSSSQIMLTLKDTKVKDLSAKIDTLTLGDAIKIDGSSSLIMQNLATTKINEMGTAVDELEMGQIMTITDSSSAILRALKTTKVKNLSAKIDTLTIDEVIEVTSSSPKILKTLTEKGVLVKNLDSAINTLQIGEIMDNVSTNTILKHLEKSTLSSLSEDVNKLTIQQIFCDDIYQKVYFAGNTQVYKSGDKYYTDEKCENEYVGGEDIIDLFIASESKDTSDVGTCQYLFHDPADNKYHYYNVATKKESTQTGLPVLTGVWSYLLTKNGAEEPYALTQTGHLIDNMTVNIQSATLQELKDNKLFVLDQDTLDKKVLTQFTLKRTIAGQEIEITQTITSDPLYTDKDLGDLTILQLMNYVTAVLNAIGG